MWKRLKRMWFGDRQAVENDDVDAVSAPAEEAPESQPAAPVDPLQQAIDAFDALARDIGAAQAMPELRSLLLEAPDDERLLRRASELLRELGDEELAGLFDAASRSNRAGPLTALAESFVGMGDAELALAIANEACAREARDIDALLVAATALAALDRHAEVLERVGDALAAVVGGTETSARLAVRFGISALMLGDLARFAEVEAELDEAAPWLLAAGERVKAHGSPGHGAERQQQALFTLYGTVLLDTVPRGAQLPPETLARWVAAVAGLLGADRYPDAGILEPVESLRPTWLSPRGEVVARWIASLLPHRPNPIPLTARLPGQRVMVVVIDDGELAQLWETKSFFDAPTPIFQLFKDPAELGSPLADVIGALQTDVVLPFESLEAERVADRVSPKQLALELQAGVGIVDRAAVERLLHWAEARRGYLLCDLDLAPDTRPLLGSDGI